MVCPSQGGNAMSSETDSDNGGNDNDYDGVLRFDGITNGGEGNFAKFDGPQGAPIVGLNLHLRVFEKAGRDEPFDAIESRLQFRKTVYVGEGEGATVEVGRETPNYVVYESSIIGPVYIHKDIVGDEEPPEQVTLTVNEVDIELYEQQDSRPNEEEIESLLSAS